jgi:hypothetical protein
MLGQEGGLRPIAGLVNKLPEHAARIAGVLTLVRDLGAAEIAAGIVLTQHYAGEMLWLDGGSRISADLRLAQRALDWLLRQWAEPAISLPDLYQRSPGAIRDGTAARKVVWQSSSSMGGWFASPKELTSRVVQRRDVQYGPAWNSPTNLPSTLLAGRRDQASSMPASGRPSSTLLAHEPAAGIPRE